jgi:subtilisin family serine protease
MINYFRNTVSFSRFVPFVCLIGVWSSLTLVAPNPFAAPQPTSKISPALRQAFLQQGTVDYLVVFGDEADLRSAAALPTKAAKTRFVYDQLRWQADHSQAAVLTLLKREGVSWRQHYLINAIAIRSDTHTAQQLAALSNVRRLSLVKPLAAPLPKPDTNQFPIPNPQSLIPNYQLPITNLQSPTAIEWGVARVKAPEVWNTYGKRGEGIVVATADTGVQWDHPALKPHYRGWNGVTATHTYHWHDAIHGASTACGSDTTIPCDDNGHGTHVTGIMVGDDGAGNQIGVAPGAQWIGCRNMANGWGTIARYIECFEFFLAPYPPNGNPLTDGRPDLAADIINNSWSCPPPSGGEDCDLAHLNDIRTSVQNLEAAGILVVAAASNYGSACSTVREPPAIYPETFAVGATDSGDNIASFSSRGPVTIDGSNRRKPDVSAPGVNVRSSYPTNSYTTLNGTSMASPHASGVAALLWSVVPTMSGNITQTKTVLQDTAFPRTTLEGCGGDSGAAVPNNVYGYGIVNAFAAVQQFINLDKQLYFPFVAR